MQLFECIRQEWMVCGEIITVVLVHTLNSNSFATGNDHVFILPLETRQIVL